MKFPPDSGDEGEEVQLLLRVSGRVVIIPGHAGGQGY